MIKKHLSVHNISISATLSHTGERVSSTIRLYSVLYPPTGRCCFHPLPLEILKPSLSLTFVSHTSAASSSSSSSSTLSFRTEALSDGADGGGIQRRFFKKHPTSVQDYMILTRLLNKSFFLFGESRAVRVVPREETLKKKAKFQFQVAKQQHQASGGETGKEKL